jgi:hypothetical protein
LRVARRLAYRAQWRVRKHWHIVAAIALAAVGVWWGWARAREPHPGSVDPSTYSRDLPRDIKQMWETPPLSGDAGPQAGPHPRGSTDRAINAASRVFNTAPLVGLTREQVVALLGDPRKSNDSLYNFPFWPAPAGAMVYRFDCGAYGWQFNLPIGIDGKVSAVDRRWIH